MKIMRSMVYILLLFALLLPRARGQSYGISIGGVELTVNNVGSLGDAAVFPSIKSGAGSVQYKADVGILRLEDAQIEGEVSISSPRGTSVELAGYNTIEAKSSGAVGLQVSGGDGVKVAGEGILHIWAAGVGCKVMENAFLSVAGKAHLYVYGAKYGLCGADPATSNIRVEGSGSLYALGDETGSLAQITLSMFPVDDMQIRHPAGAIYSAANHSVERNGSVVREPIAICMDTPSVVPFAFDGAALNSAFVPFLCGTQHGIFGTKPFGTIRYDPLEKALFLRNFDHTSTGGNTVLTTDDLQHIYIDGSCEMSSAQAVFAPQRDVEIHGSGSLSLHSTDPQFHEGVVRMGDMTLELTDGVDFSVKAAGKYGFVSTGSTSKLIVNKAMLHVESTEEAVHGVKAELRDAVIIGSVGTIVQDGEFKQNGNPVPHLTIESQSDVYFVLGGVPVTRNNYPMLKDKQGPFSALLASGSAEYDKDNATLMLDGAMIDTKDQVLQVFTPLKVALKGSSKLKGSSGIEALKPLVFHGEGSLAIEASGASSAALHIGKQVVVSIADASVSLMGRMYAIKGEQNSQISVNGALHLISADKIIEGVELVMQDGVAILSPSKATYDADTKQILNEHGEELTGAIVEIGKGSVTLGFKIGGVEVTRGNASFLNDPSVFPALKEGSMRYIEGDNTLYLTGTLLEYVDGPVIENAGCKELTIVVEEAPHRPSVALHGGAGVGILLRENTNIRLVSANMEIKVSDGQGISVGRGKLLTVQGAGEYHVSIFAKQGIAGIDGSMGGTLHIHSGGAVQIVSEGRTIGPLSGMYFGEGSEVLVPAGAKMREGILQTDDGQEVDQFAILGGEQTPLGIWLGEEALTKTKVALLPKLSMGGLAYDLASNTLIMDHGKAFWSNVTSIHPKQNLHLNAGLSLITPSSDQSIAIHANTLHISGEGSLIALDGIKVRDALILSGKVHLLAFGKHAISSVNPQAGNRFKLHILDEARLMAESDHSIPTIEGLGGLDLADGVQVHLPVGYKHDPQKHNGAICDSEDVPFTHRILIGKPAFVDYKFALAKLGVDSYNYPLLEFDLMRLDAECRFDPTNGELYLSRAQLEGELYLSVDVGSLLRTLRVEGSCRLSTQTNISAIELKSDLTITGTGSLEVLSKNKHAVELGKNAKLTFDGQVDIAMNGREGTIAGDNENTAQVDVKACAGLYLVGGSNPTVRGLMHFNVGEGLGIQEPEAARFDAAKHAIVLADGSICQAAVRVGVAKEDYHFSIGGTLVNSWNMRLALSQLASSAGSVSFDAKTGTLVLDQAQLESLNTPVIATQPNSKLKRIEVRGRCRVSSKIASNLLQFDSDVEVEGRGKLQLDSKSYGIMLGDGVTLTLDGALHLKVDGLDGGISGPTGKFANLAIRYATLEAKGINIAAVQRVKLDINADANVITDPAEAQYIESKLAICDVSGEPVKGHRKVVVGPVKYGFSIGDVAVNYYNVGSLNDRQFFPAYESGELAYDRTTGTLSLRDVRLLSAENGLEVHNDLILSLDGSSSLHILEVKKAQLRVKGSGQLEVLSINRQAVTLDEGASLILSENATLVAQGTIGIYADRVPDGTLEVLDKSRAVLRGVQAPLLKVRLVMGAGVGIVDPAGVTFSDTQLQFMRGSTPVHGEQVVVGQPIVPQEASIRLTPSALTLVIKSGMDKGTINAEVSPSTFSQTVVWHSDKSEVAEVDAHTGEVTAMSVGTAQITATSTANVKLKAICEVVVRDYKPVAGIELGADFELVKGEEKTLNPIIAPADADDKTITWSSDNESVATVVDGKVTAVGEGTATISATSVDGPIGTCTVTVKLRELKGITLSSSIIALAPNAKSEPLTVIFDPADWPNQAVRWSSDNESVATVADGVIKAVAKGETIITATSESDSDKQAICTVKVVDADLLLTAIKLSKTSLTLGVGQSESLVVEFTPSNAANQEVKWSSSNPAVATVEDGKVVGKSQGTAEIVVRSTQGGFTDKCSVEVIAPVGVSEIRLDRQTLSLIVGETTELVASILPSNATEQRVEWSSSNTQVASVTNGKVLAVGQGVAQIKVRSVDGGKEASCEVVVRPRETASVGSWLLADAVAVPNPFDAKLVVRNAANAREYAVLNTVGQVVLRGSNVGGDALHIDLSTSASGVYLLRLQAADGVRILRVVKR